MFFLQQLQAIQNVDERISARVDPLTLLGFIVYTDVHEWICTFYVIILIIMLKF